MNIEIQQQEREKKKKDNGSILYSITTKNVEKKSRNIHAMYLYINTGTAFCCCHASKRIEKIRRKKRKREANEDFSSISKMMKLFLKQNMNILNKPQ